MSRERTTELPGREVAMVDIDRWDLVCACGGLITTVDHPDLVVHALRVHQGLERHRRWRQRQEPPSFEVEVR